MLKRLGTVIASMTVVGVMAGSSAEASVFPVGPVAGGGAYVVESCGDAGSDDGWTVANGWSVTLTAATQCPPRAGNLGSPFEGSYLQSGVFASDHLNNGGTDAAEGSHAELTWTATLGTTITRIRMWRVVAKQFDDDWHPYISVVGTSTPLESCEINGNGSCHQGADAWSPNNPDPTGLASYRDVTGINTTGLIVGISCRNNATHFCGNGGSIPDAEAAVYGAFFTLSDNSAPTLANPNGAGWTGISWQQGTLPLTVSSSDNAGISATRLYVDGALVATAPGSCSWDRPRPCTDQTDASVPIDTTKLADGTHTVQVAAVDAAGNEKRVTRPLPLQVDNYAPAAPTGLTASSTSAPQINFTWSLPADSGAPIVGARYSLCQASGCTAPQPTTTTTSLDALRLPNPGAYTVRVWLVDERGHGDPASAASIAVENPQGPAGTQTTTGPTTTVPTTSTTTKKPSAKLKLASATLRGTRLRVTGTLSKKASGHVTIRYRVGTKGHYHALRKTARIRKGRFALTVKLSRTFARAKTGTLTVSYAGDRDTAKATRTKKLRRR